MTPLSGSTAIIPKKIPLAFFVAAAAAIGLPHFASAQTRPAPSPDTVAALWCVLYSKSGSCANFFDEPARGVASRRMLDSRLPRVTFRSGELRWAAYAGTIPSTDAYRWRFLHGEATDVYEVKFSHQVMTYYITRPGPDGKIRYLLMGTDPPDEEKWEQFVDGPG